MDLKEIIKTLGLELNEEQQKKLDEVNENWIPQTRFNEVNTKLKEQQAMVGERDKQLEELKASANGSEELQKKIAELTEANQKTKNEYESKYEELNFASQMKGAASKFKVKDKFIQMAQSQIDRAKLEKQEDGTYKGLDDQLTKLIETYPEYVDTTPAPSSAGRQAGGSVDSGKEAENQLRIAMGLKPLD